MDFNEHLHSSAACHSVKEAVISFFVRPRIEQPSKYRELIGSDTYIRRNYAKFEPVREISLSLNVNKANTELRQVSDAGFKFIGYKNGATSDIIQGINEPRRSLFTFNTLAYDRWDGYLGSTMAAVKEIASFGQPFWVTAYGLMFIDEFYVDDKKEYSASELFSLESRYLPVGIEDSSFVDFSLNLNKQKDSRKYVENMQIKVFDRNAQKVVQIIDNISFIQDGEQMLFSDLVNSEKPENDLCFAHTENKQMLISLLKPEISKSIGLCAC